MGFATQIVSLRYYIRHLLSRLLTKSPLWIENVPLWIHRLNLTGSTAENPSKHKSRHCIRSAGSPKQWWWRLTSTIDRNWSLTRDLAVPSVAAYSVEHMWLSRPYLSSRKIPYTDRVSSVSRAVETTFHTLPSLTKLTSVWMKSKQWGRKGLGLTVRFPLLLWEWWKLLFFLLALATLSS